MFFDETGSDNLSHQRPYGWALEGRRTTEETFQIRRQRVTAMALMHHTGVLDWMIVPGGAGTLDLLECARTTLVRQAVPCDGCIAIGALHQAFCLASCFICKPDRIQRKRR